MSHSNEKFLTRKITNITHAIGVCHDGIMPCAVYPHVQSHIYAMMFAIRHVSRWSSKRLYMPDSQQYNTYLFEYTLLLLF